MFGGGLVETTIPGPQPRAIHQQDRSQKVCVNPAHASAEMPTVFDKAQNLVVQGLGRGLHTMKTAKEGGSIGKVSHRQFADHEWVHQHLLIGQ